MQRKTKIWLQQHKSDYYTCMAKHDKYLARSAYKLLEINNRFKILPLQGKILDLGAAPGSWIQVIHKYMYMPKSSIIAVDLLPLQIKLANVVYIQGDFTNALTQKKIQQHGQFHTIISDMAPNTIGNKQIDHIRTIQLCEIVLSFIQLNLIQEGNLVMKFFQGSEDKELLKKISNYFTNTQIFKPKASRTRSSEQYIIAQNFKGKI